MWSVFAVSCNANNVMKYWDRNSDWQKTSLSPPQLEELTNLPTVLSVCQVTTLETLLSSVLLAAVLRKYMYGMVILLGGPRYSRNTNTSIARKMIFARGY
jgi:hypothetical protein